MGITIVAGTLVALVGGLRVLTFMGIVEVRTPSANVAGWSTGTAAEDGWPFASKIAVLFFFCSPNLACTTSGIFCLEAEPITWHRNQQNTYIMQKCWRTTSEVQVESCSMLNGLWITGGPGSIQQAFPQRWQWWISLISMRIRLCDTPPRSSLSLSVSALGFEGFAIFLVLWFTIGAMCRYWRSQYENKFVPLTMHAPWGQQG